jgi:hypothetical protein
MIPTCNLSTITEHRIMIDTPTNPYTIAKAGKTLGQWHILKAHKKSRVLGFSYEPSDEAPSTFEGVKAAYRSAMMKRHAFPVWSGGSDATIYQSPEANFAFRYLHDTAHVECSGDFTFEGERKTALHMAQGVIQAFGDSLETRIYLADSLGQVHFHAQTGGQFPADQAAFVSFVVARGESLGLHAFTVSLPGLVCQWLATQRHAH